MGITGRKIDLAKIEPRRFGTSEQKAALESKDYFKQLTKLTAEVAQEQNQIIEQEYGIKNVIMENGSLSMDAFTEDQKGPYPKFGPQSVAADKQELERRELQWSKVTEVEKVRSAPAVFEQKRSQLLRDYGLRLSENEKVNWKNKVREAYLSEREQEKSSQLEMAINVLFHKILKEEFLVVRASKFDDYDNGADNVIVNKKTGEVVCAVDEVHQGEAGDRVGSKISKTTEINEKGGTKLKYGVTFTQGNALEKSRLLRKPIDHIPSLFIAVSPPELNQLLHAMESSTEIADIERTMFYKILDHLEAQARDPKNETFHPEIKIKLEGFLSSLQRMRELADT